jgi:hypothetical protein
VKPNLLRRAAQQIGNHILGNWFTCWDPVHLGGMRTLAAFEEMARERFGPLVDLAWEELLHGHILPLQRVQVLIDESAGAALGKCVCRASKVTTDVLDPSGHPYLIGSAEEHDRQLGSIMAAYHLIQKGTDADEPTSPRLLSILEAVDRRTDLDATARLGMLWEQSYPYWEVLLSHKRFTKLWADNMKQHAKALPVHRTLLKALVNAQYHTRGAVFTGMEVLDEAYCICTCPGPENDQGCSLVNWYYFSRLDHAIYPNETDFFGQARDSEGNVLPCQRFEARQTRPCLGCGCEHEKTAISS